MGERPPTPLRRIPGNRRVDRSSGNSGVNELALLSIVCAVANFFFLPGIGAIAAVLLGKRAIREIEATGNQQRGEALADWGISVGYGGLLAVLIFLVVLALMYFHVLPLGHPSSY